MLTCGYRSHITWEQKINCAQQSGNPIIVPIGCHQHLDTAFGLRLGHSAKLNNG
jgi:hypothetical protein